MSNNQLFFSIVIPIYNKLSHLERSINSVLSQSYKYFELILIDDSSTDGSFEKANGFCDERIKLIKRSEPGPGGYAARNLGIQVAQHEWICFLDADDEWKPNHLENINRAITSNLTINTFVSSYLFADAKGQRPHQYYAQFKDQGSHVFDLIRFLKHKPIWTSALCVKKEAIVNAGLFPEGRTSRGGDTETWLRLMYQERKGYWINQCTAVYHRDSENMVTKKVGFNISDHVLYNTVQNLLDVESDCKIKNALKAHWNSTATTYFKNMSKKQFIGLSDLMKYYWLAKPFKRKPILYALYSFKNIFWNMKS